MIRLARGLKCGALGARGLATSPALAVDCWARPARAREPKPQASVCRAERRDWSGKLFMAGGDEASRDTGNRCRQIMSDAAASTFSRKAVNLARGNYGTFSFPPW